MFKKLVSLAPVFALVVIACGNANHAPRSVTKAVFVDAHATSVFDDDVPEVTDALFVIEATPNPIPRTPAPTARAPVSFTRG